MNNIMEALKSKILSIFQSEWREEQKQMEAEAEARRNSVVNAEVTFKETFKEFYELLFEAGLYQGMKVRDAYRFHGFEVIIGTEEKTFSMTYDQGRIQPNERTPFDLWPVERLIKEVQVQLKIMSAEELEIERAKIIQPVDL